MDEIEAALVRLNDAICMFERGSFQEFTLALIPHNPDLPMHVSLNGKPVLETLHSVALADALTIRHESDVADVNGGDASLLRKGDEG